MEYKAAIVNMKAHVNASGDLIQRITLELHGDVRPLHDLMKEPLNVRIEKENA